MLQSLKLGIPLPAPITQEVAGRRALERRWATANERRGGKANPIARSNNTRGRRKAAFFVLLERRDEEPRKSGSDHKQKADFRMPVGNADERRGGKANPIARSNL